MKFTHPRCLKYDRLLDEWVEGPMMNYRRYNGGTSVRLTDGRYFVMGTDRTYE